MNYYPALDGVRAISVVLVMLHHFQLLSFGWMGVQIFFVLSGFLITRILMRQKAALFGDYLGCFYIRRILRIFPLYFGYLILLMGIDRFWGPAHMFKQWQYFLFTYTYNFSRLIASLKHAGFELSFSFSHFWSLCVEEQFYFIWPFVIYFFPERIIKIIVAGLMFAIPLFRALMGWVMLHQGLNDMGGVVNWLTLCQMDSFAAGAVMAIFKPKINPDICFRLLGGLFVLILILVLYNLRTFGSKEPGVLASLGYAPDPPRDNFLHVWSYSLFNIAAAFLIYGLTLSETGWSRFFSFPWLTQTGKISYGIYVFHLFPINIFYEVFRLSPFSVKALALFPVYFLTVYFMASCSYRFYERRFLELKKKFEPRWLSFLPMKKI